MALEVLRFERSPERAVFIGVALYVALRRTHPQANPFVLVEVVVDEDDSGLVGAFGRANLRHGAQLGFAFAATQLDRTLVQGDDRVGVDRVGELRQRRFRPSPGTSPAPLP